MSNSICSNLGSVNLTGRLDEVLQNLSDLTISPELIEPIAAGHVSAQDAACKPPLLNSFWKQIDNSSQRIFVLNQSSSQTELLKKIEEMANQLERQFNKAYSYDKDNHTLTTNDPSEVKKLLLLSSLIQRTLAANETALELAVGHSRLTQYLNLAHPDLLEEDRSALYYFYQYPKNYKFSEEETLKYYQSLAGYDGSLPFEKTPQGRSSSLVGMAQFAEFKFDTKVFADWQAKLQLPINEFLTILEKIEKKESYQALSAHTTEALSQRQNVLYMAYAAPALTPAERKNLFWETTLINDILTRRGANSLQNSIDHSKNINAKYGLNPEITDFIHSNWKTTLTPHTLDDNLSKSEMSKVYTTLYMNLLTSTAAEIASDGFMNVMNIFGALILPSTKGKNYQFFAIEDFKKLREQAQSDIKASQSKVNQFINLIDNHYGSIAALHADPSDQIKTSIDELLKLIPDMNFTLPNQTQFGGDLTVNVKEFIRAHTDLVVFSPTFDHSQALGTAFNAFHTTLINKEVLSRDSDASEKVQVALLTVILLHEAAHTYFYEQHYSQHPERGMDKVANERFAYALTIQYLNSYIAANNQLTDDERTVINSIIKEYETNVRYANTQLGLDCQDMRPHIWHEAFTQTPHHQYVQIADYSEAAIWPLSEVSQTVAQKSIDEKVDALSKLFTKTLQAYKINLDPTAVEKLKEGLKQIYNLQDEDLSPVFEATHPLNQYMQIASQGLIPVYAGTGRTLKHQLDIQLSNIEKNKTFFPYDQEVFNDFIAGLDEAGTMAASLLFDDIFETKPMDPLQPEKLDWEDSEDVYPALVDGLNSLYLLAGDEYNFDTYHSLPPDLLFELTIKSYVHQIQTERKQNNECR